MGGQIELFGDAGHDDVLCRLRGSLLCGAVGDALGAPLEFYRASDIARRYGPDGPVGYVAGAWPAGTFTDDTQMTLFTAEGIIRAAVCSSTKGICHPPSVVHHAYLRWLHTQGIPVPGIGENEGWPDGWLVKERLLHARRAPGNTCLGGLESAKGVLGTKARNHSKGCGTVMRMAPAGVLVLADSPERAFEEACEYSALTHGHPTSWVSAGLLAEVVGYLLLGRDLRAGVGSARDRIRRHEHGAETVSAVDQAVQEAERGDPPSEAVARLGEGWIAEEALAIGLYAALVADDVRTALRIAVNHSGDSDSTGAIAGNLLGALHGVEAIPGDLLSSLEGREVIDRVACDLHRYVLDPPDEITEQDFERYPGW